MTTATSNDTTTATLQQYFSIVHKHTPDEALIGLTCIETNGTTYTNWFCQATMHELYRIVAQFNGDMNVYARVPPLLTRPGAGKRGKERDSAGASVLWADVDCYGNVDATLEKLQALVLQPTLTVSSGGGLHLYYMLDGFCADIAGLKSRNKGLMQHINKLLGVKDADSVFDLARVLRLPGTDNLKYAPAKPCTILEYHPDRVYRLEDFETAQLTENDWKPLELDDTGPLVDDFLTKLGNEYLADRIASEATARQRGAKLTKAGNVDRSENDWYITTQLLTMGYAIEDVVKVLTHNQWFSGEKYHKNGFYYVENTVRKAVSKLGGKPMSNDFGTAAWHDALTTLGYTFKLNECDDTIEMNGQPLTDPLEAKIIMQMRAKGFKNDAVTRNAIKAIAYDNRYHPIKEYLNGLQWDGNDHIRTLAGHLHDIHDPIVYDTGVAERVSYVYLKRWLIGAVNKVFNPGPMGQNPMLVIVGPQNCGKSAFSAYLGSALPDRFARSAIHPDDKDHLLRLASLLVWDVDELDATTRRADVSALKAFITKDKIVARKSYGRYEAHKLAIASFTGSVNPNGAGFLLDDTGNRRYLTIEVDSIDWKYTQIPINQLWAQAVALYHNGERPELLPVEASTRDSINTNYEPQDIVEDMLRAYFNITPGTDDFLSTLEIIDHLHAWGKPIAGTEKAQTMAIAKAAHKLGLGKPKQIVRGGPRGYRGISRKDNENLLTLTIPARHERN